MTAPLLTYRDVIEKVVQWISRECVNTHSDWGTNSKYTFYRKDSTQEIGRTRSTYADTHHYNCSVFSVKVANGVSDFSDSSQSYVDNDIQNYFTSVGLPLDKWDYPIDNKNLYNLLYDIAYFCSYTVCWAVTSMPANLKTKDGTNRTGTGKNSIQNWDTHIGENMDKIVVYASQEVVGGKVLDPQPEGTENVEIEDAGGTEKKYVVGKTREHTLKGSDIKEMVDSILLNKLPRKIITVTYSGTASTW